MYLKCKYCGKEIDCDEYDFPREHHDCKRDRQMSCKTCQYCGKQIPVDEHGFPREYHDCKNGANPDSSSAIPKKEEKCGMDNYPNLYVENTTTTFTINEEEMMRRKAWLDLVHALIVEKGVTLDVAVVYANQVYQKYDESFNKVKED